MKIYNPLTSKWRELLIVLVLSIFSFNINAQEIDSLIIWNKNYKLSWDDFLASPNYQKRATALSYLEMILIRSYFNNEIHSYTIIPTFNRYYSYCKNKKNSNLLEHEQMHFDIQEVFARKIRKEFLRLNLNNACEFSYNKIFNSYADSIHMFQNKYDFHTNYSRRKQQQKTWNNTVSIELRKLKLFSINKVYGIKENY